MAARDARKGRRRTCKEGRYCYCTDAYMHVLLAKAGHVGADNVGVLLAEEPHKQDKIILIIDVGTNAEIY